MKKTQEEIEKLKAGWLKDPCWDIEKSEGFEEHEKELLIFRKDREAKTEAKIKERQEARWKKITREVGYLDFETAMSLSTSAEIEGELIRLDNQIGDAGSATEWADFVLKREQVRATLLLAAQVKRIADKLEKMDDDDETFDSVKIWGTGDK